VAHVIQEGITQGTVTIFMEHVNIAPTNTVLKVFIYDGRFEHGLVAFLLGFPAHAETPSPWNFGKGCNRFY
jgi:hypothetical protein